MKPDDGYICFIVNPKSGPSGSKLMGRRFLDYLVSKGYDVKVQPTASLENACDLAADAAVDFDCAMVVAVGGDGTVREVIHGLEGSDKPMMIVPEGTENLLANELGYDENLSTIIQTFQQSYTRELDIGVANGRCFTSVAGFGFDGKVISRMSRQRRGHIDHFDYFWPLWRTFWDYKFEAMKVDVDGEKVFEGQGLIFVGNISRYAMGLGILNRADFSDGLLDVCIYRCGGKIHLVKHSLMTVIRQHLACRDVLYYKARRVLVSSQNNDVYCELDGDPGPELPVDITVLPKAVNLILPKDAKPAGIRTRIFRAFR